MCTGAWGRWVGGRELVYVGRWLLGEKENVLSDKNIFLVDADGDAVCMLVLFQVLEMPFRLMLGGFPDMLLIELTSLPCDTRYVECRWRPSLPGCKSIVI